MKNTFQISKQQITYLSEISKEAKSFFKSEFPEAFEPELKTGIWYRNKCNVGFVFLTNINNESICGLYGFDCLGNWFHFDRISLELFKKIFEPATEEEVFERLKEEAVKRGFKKGVIVDRKICNVDFMCDEIIITEMRNDDFSFNHYKIGDLSMDKKIIFANGVWAGICITKEEAEKELGKKII